MSYYIINKNNTLYSSLTSSTNIAIACLLPKYFKIGDTILDLKKNKKGYVVKKHQDDGNVLNAFYSIFLINDNKEQKKVDLSFYQDIISKRLVLTEKMLNIF